MKATEKQIETSILQWLRLHKIFSWKNQSQGTFDPVKKIYRRNFNPFQIKGTSDIIGILPDGRLLAIEVKSATGRPSEEQIYFISNVKLSNGVAFIARSIEDVEENLKPILKGIKR